MISGKLIVLRIVFQLLNKSLIGIYVYFYKDLTGIVCKYVFFKTRWSATAIGHYMYALIKGGQIQMYICVYRPELLYLNGGEHRVTAERENEGAEGEEVVLEGEWRLAQVCGARAVIQRSADQDEDHRQCGSEHRQHHDAPSKKCVSMCLCVCVWGGGVLFRKENSICLFVFDLSLPPPLLVEFLHRNLFGQVTSALQRWSCSAISAFS